MSLEHEGQITVYELEAPFRVIATYEGFEVHETMQAWAAIVKRIKDIEGCPDDVEIKLCAPTDGRVWIDCLSEKFMYENGGIGPDNPGDPLWLQLEILSSDGCLNLSSIPSVKIDRTMKAFCLVCGKMENHKIFDQTPWRHSLACPVCKSETIFTSGHGGSG